MNEIKLNFTEVNGVKTMSSLELAALCVGDSQDAHSNFMKKAKKVIGESKLVNFYEHIKYMRGTRTYLNLPEREACLMAMSYSYELQAKVYDAWHALAKPVELTDEQKLLVMAQGVIKLTAERDEAVKTKALIGSKREATAMATASAASKRVKKLEAQIQSEGNYLSVIAASLPDRVDTETKPNVQTWRLLKAISSNLGHDIIKAPCQRYGEVNTYHVDVIAEFKHLYI